MSGRKKKTEKEDDEVEELLRAAEDSMLLKLSLNSHMSRGSSSTIIDPDLDRRFQALRSKPTRSKSKPNPPPSLLPNPPPSLLPNPPPSISSVATDLDRDEKPQEDDLFARFAALKSSIPAHSSSSSLLNEQQQKFMNGDDEDDEVEKLIKWAVDAARLDPSPPSDSDDDTDHSDDDDEDDDDRMDRKKKKGKRK